jgi:acyl-CoA synthetase (AMP-forming)/AMP-acid ligase II
MREEFRSLSNLLCRSAERQGDRRLYTFLGNGESETALLTYAELHARARSIGVLLSRIAAPGERALLLYPPGLEFPAAFFGCLYAQVIAVPAFPPRPNRGLLRLTSILRDAEPTLLLTTSAELPRVEELARQAAGPGRLRVVATDVLDLTLAEEWRDPGSGADTIAYLQYTSGSTAAPKGVIVTHGNVLHNSECLDRCYGHTADSILVSWLPAFHDFGLVFGLLQPLYAGYRAVLMPPLAFLQRPLRWLNAVSRYRASHTGAPNFAYELCVQKTTPEQRQTLDLSALEVAAVGAEPVRASTLERFSAAFAASGFHSRAFSPGYGLAEATLIVTGLPRREIPVVLRADGPELERHRARRVAASDPGAVPLVGCGKAEMDTEVAIVDPRRRVRLAADEVGEIWVGGPSLARGYWNRPEESGAIFAARLAGGGGGAVAGAAGSSGDLGDGPYLRTGDLGFVVQGNLFVTGRIKDLIIIDGRNIYPQDIEHTVEGSHPALRANGCAAFSIDRGDEEWLVVVAELERRPPVDRDELVKAIRRAVAEEHDVRVADVVPIRAAGLPRTSSGKVRRSACRTAYLEKTLEAIGGLRREAVA